MTEDQNNEEESTVIPGSYTEQLMEAIREQGIGDPITLSMQEVNQPFLHLAPRTMISPQYQLRKIARKRAVDQLMMTDFIRAPEGICPRCGEDCPRPGRRGQYPGAVSRTDNRTEVCSPCGDDEGFEDMRDLLTPQEDWPVERTVDLAATWEQNRGAGGSPMMPFPGPKELPDLRLHFLDRWQPSGLFEKVALTADPYNGAGWAQLARTSLQDASLWWVKEDMVQLTLAASGGIPADATGFDFQLPANQQRGLVCFERPWQSPDAKEPGVQVMVSAFCWDRVKMEGQPCFHFTWYSYLDFAAGMDRHQLQTAVDQRLIQDAHMEQWRTTEGGLASRVRGGAWALLGATTWPLKDSIESFDVFDSLHNRKANALGKESMIADRRFFAAFCTLVNMRLTHVEEEHVPNYRRKQAKRSGHPITNPSPVRIVRLREVRSDDDTDRDPDAEKKVVNWSHRWIVNGYWKYVWYGPGKTKKRLIYIAPFMKGPKDKPLIIKDTVRTWVE